MRICYREWGKSGKSWRKQRLHSFKKQGQGQRPRPPTEKRRQHLLQSFFLIPKDFNRRVECSIDRKFKNEVQPCRLAWNTYVSISIFLPGLKRLLQCSLHTSFLTLSLSLS
jgi:hypothetical protein